MPKKVIAIKTPDLANELNAELLGIAIKARRTQSQLRLQDAADLCGVAKQTLMSIEHGHDSIKLSTVLQICSGLGIKLRILPWTSEEELSDDWQ